MYKNKDFTNCKCEWFLYLRRATFVVQYSCIFNPFSVRKTDQHFWQCESITLINTKMVKFDNAKTRPYQNKRVPGKMQTHFFKLAKRKNYDIKVNTKRKNTTHQTY